MEQFKGQNCIYLTDKVMNKSLVMTNYNNYNKIVLQNNVRNKIIQENMKISL